MCMMYNRLACIPTGSYSVINDHATSHFPHAGNEPFNKETYNIIYSSVEQTNSRRWNSYVSRSLVVPSLLTAHQTFPHTRKRKERTPAIAGRPLPAHCPSTHFPLHLLPPISRNSIQTLPKHFPSSAAAFSDADKNLHGYLWRFLKNI